MRRQVAFLLATLILFVLALVFVERVFSPSFQQCINQNNSTKAGTADKETNAPSSTTIFNYVRCTGEFLDQSEGTVTAIATIVIAAFTCTLWIATSQQALLTREAFIADKRAFVFASGIQPLYEPDVTTGH